MKKLKFLAVFCLFIIGIQANSQSKSCQYYRTGTFLLVDNQMGLSVKIERTETRQKESDLNTGKYTVFQVNWLNDCEYELTAIDGTSDLVSYFKTKKLILKILDVYADGYRFEGHIKGTNTFKTQIMKVY